MKFEALTDETIIVELTDDDMKNLNITYEEMDYSKVETKRVIWTILARAGRSLGKELNTHGRLLVEAMRRDCGGCVLFFSVEREQRQKPKKYLVKKREYITCGLKTADALLACAQRLCMAGYRPESKLYADNGSYRLLVRPGWRDGGIKACLREFGEIIGESAVLTELTDEHWHCLADKNAVELLSSETGAS